MSSTVVRAGAGPVDDEERRLDVLHRSGLLDTDGSEPFDRLARMASRLLDVDTALVSLVDARQQVFTGHHGLRLDLAARGATPLSHSYCKFPVATGERLVVSDARESALLSESPAIDDLDAVAYVGIPLETSEGVVLGTLCVLHATPRSWTGEEVATLEELAALALTEIEYRLSRHDIEDVAGLARRLEDPVTRLGDVTRTIAHLVERPEADPRLPRLADVARDRMSTVEALTHDLVAAAQPDGRSDGPDTVDVRQVLRRTTDLVLSTARADDLLLELPDVAAVVRAPLVPTSRALNLVVTMAMTYVRPGDRVELTLSVSEDEARVTVRAPGAAVPAGELLRLAAHFRSPAGEELPTTVTAGVRGTRVQNSVMAATTDPVGSFFDVRLPLASRA